MRFLLPVLTFSLLAWAGAECVSMPGEKLLNERKVTRLETRTTPSVDRPQVVNVRIATFKDGKITSEASYPLSDPADSITWSYQYQAGRLERMLGVTGSRGTFLGALPGVTERTFRYDARGRLLQESDGAVLLGLTRPVSETTCVYSPDGRNVTETTRTLTETAPGPLLLTEYALDGQGRPVTVSLKDDLSGKMAETTRFQFSYQPQGGYSRREQQMNAFSGEVMRKRTATFDRWGRLLRLDTSAGPACSGQEAQVRTYAYRVDSVGNWVERQETIVRMTSRAGPVAGEVVRRTFVYGP